MAHHHKAERHSHRADLDAVARRVMKERGLLPDFSAEVLGEVRAITAKGAARDASLVDLTSKLWVSIDNDDSRDLDQISFAEPLDGGDVRLLVGVADVDALVARGSAIDGHARVNTTSVYTAARVFPMLPEELSTDLTSLNDGQAREAIVVDMTIAEDGEVRASHVVRAMVENRAKLAYNSVSAWLDGAAPPPKRMTEVSGVDEQLKLQDRVAQALRRRRFERGALTLETLEARAVFDDGDLVDLVPEGRSRAKNLIEDVMIAANTATARFLDSKRFPSLRRVLRSPERWAKIVSLANDLGDDLPAEPSNAALEAFLARRREAAPSRFADLSLAVVKLLGRGEYVLERPGQGSFGHFGLALRDYTHSTAPNRRYPDLVTHRLLKAALSSRPAPYSDVDLEALARHCTEQENAAAKVERRVRKSAAALLLARRIGQRFDAIVAGAAPKGTYVRISHPAAEGRLVEGTRGLEVGDRVEVELVHTDFEQGYIDFRRV